MPKPPKPPLRYARHATLRVITTRSWRKAWVDHLVVVERVEADGPYAAPYWCRDTAPPYEATWFDEDELAPGPGDA